MILPIKWPVHGGELRWTSGWHGVRTQILSLRLPAFVDIHRVWGWNFMTPISIHLSILNSSSTPKSQSFIPTVDGRNPAPVDRWFIPWFLGFQPSFWWCRISSIHSIWGYRFIILPCPPGRKALPRPCRLAQAPKRLTNCPPCRRLSVGLPRSSKSWSGFV